MKLPPAPLVRSVLVSAFVIAIAGLASPLDVGAQTYTNPVANADIPRPFVVKDGSTYYAFAGKTRIPVRTSTDIKTWGSASDTLSSPGSWASGWGTTQSAAVQKFGSTWVMYYAAKSSTENRQCIGVATATSAAGPYTAQSSPLVCNPGSGFKGAQDPTVFLSGALGGPAAQLVWVGLDVTSGAPTMILSQPLASNGLSFASGSTTATLLSPQGSGWEDGTIGSPSVVYDPSTADTSLAKIYLLYSGNEETSVHNAMNWAKCTTVSGAGGTLQQCRREILGTWMDSVTDAMAPGDATTFSDGTNQWLAYSAYPGSCNSSGQCSGGRKFRIDKLCFMSGYPRTNGPSITAQALTRNSSCGVDVQPTGGSPSLTEVGLLDQYSGGNRDGGASGVVDGESVWTFGDTLGGPFGYCVTSVNGQNILCSNSAGTADAPGGAGDPIVPVYDFPTLVPTLWIPYTAAEIADPAFTPTYRIVHWTTAAQSRDDGTALLYYGRYYVQSSPLAFIPMGNGQGCSGVACMSLDGSCPIPNTTNFANVSRLGETFDCSEPPFNFGAVVRGSYVYFYGEVSSSTFGVARVPVGQETQRSSYTFWDGSSWSTTVGDAVATGLLVRGSVSFNSYLGKYVAVGQFPDELLYTNQNFTIQTADLPQGPWSTAVSLQVLARASGQFWSNYAMIDHSELAMQRGKILTGSYYHSSHLRTVQITFP